MRLMPVLDFGGVESRIVLLSRLIDRDRFDFRVCTFWKHGAAARQIEALGVPVDVLDVDPVIPSLRATARLAAYFRRVRPDIVHASIGEANYHAAVAGTLARVPVRILEEVGMPSRGLRGRLVFRQVYRMATRMVGVTEATCKYLVASEGLPQRKVTLIHNSIRPDFFVEPQPPLDARDDRCRVLMVGRLVPVKNQILFLRAFRQALDRHPGLSLSIVGDGPLKADTEATLAALGLEASVRMLGFRDDVAALLRESDAFVLPSLSEGCSISLMEAMASAVPVIASRVAGNEETARGIDPRWFVPPTDEAGWTAALVALARMSAPERFALGLEGRRIADERFAPSAYKASVEGMYDRECGWGG